MPFTLRSRRAKYILGGLLLFLLVAGTSAAYFSGAGSGIFASCPVTKEKVIVRGGSLEPIVMSGEVITILRGYYQCREPKRNDIVVYRYGGRPDPLVKIVRGIPGDSFSVVPGDKGGEWHILVNGRVLENSSGDPYTLNIYAKDLLSLYEKDYRGRIPSEAYLLLGNLPSTEGSLDSRNFGLAGKEDLIGKVSR